MRWLFVAVLLLGGCASHRAPAPPPVTETPTSPPPPRVEEKKPALPHYRCDDNTEFDVSFGDGSAQLSFANREPETVLRDAGGTSLSQTVYSSTKLKIEFGLD